MKAILLIIIFISHLYSDFTITYLLNNNIKQTVFYKDNTHVLFKIENNNTIIEKLIILDSKKYISFKENGLEHIYEISDEISNIKENTKSKKINFTIIKKETNITYKNISAQKWFIKNKNGLKEEVIVTNNKKIYNNLQKTIDALKKLLPVNKEGEASIFNMAKGYVLLKSKYIKFVSFNEKPLKLSLFQINNTLNKEEQKELSKKIAKCFINVCCGNKITNSKELYKFLNTNKEWKLLSVAKCKENSQKELESAILTNKKKFITVEMTSKNILSGKIDSLKQHGIEVINIKKSTINGYKIKTAYLPSVNATIADITLPNTTISIYTKGKQNLKSIAKSIIKFTFHINYTLSD